MIPAPELSIKIPVLPSITLVPTSSVDPLLTKKLIAPEMVPLVFKNVCVPSLIKLTKQADEPSSVRTPPEIVRSPLIFKVPTPTPGKLDKRHSPPEITTFPETVRLDGRRYAHLI